MSFPQSIIEYFQSSKAELQKVSWPSRRDTIRYGTLVIVVSVLVAVFFAVMDTGLGVVVDALLARKASVSATAPAAQTAPEPATVPPSAATDLQTIPFQDTSGKPALQVTLPKK